jgi:hypothetical protein
MPSAKQSAGKFCGLSAGNTGQAKIASLKADAKIRKVFQVNVVRLLMENRSKRLFCENDGSGQELQQYLIIAR